MFRGAFLNTHHAVKLSKPPTAHDVKMATRRGEVAKPTVTTKWVCNASLTKFKTLMSDLKELRAAEPDMRAVVFTRFNDVQERLVELVKTESMAGGMLASTNDKGKPNPIKIYQFSSKTAPPQRHKLIADFQESTKPGARVFIVTYATAAVGITLTAASRVFLMEPSLDPAQEARPCPQLVLVTLTLSLTPSHPSLLPLPNSNSLSPSPRRKLPVASTGSGRRRRSSSSGTRSRRRSRRGWSSCMRRSSRARSNYETASSLRRRRI